MDKTTSPKYFCFVLFLFCFVWWCFGFCVCFLFVCLLLLFFLLFFGGGGWVCFFVLFVAFFFCLFFVLSFYLCVCVGGGVKLCRFSWKLFFEGSGWYLFCFSWFYKNVFERSGFVYVYVFVVFCLLFVFVLLLFIVIVVVVGFLFLFFVVCFFVVNPSTQDYSVDVVSVNKKNMALRGLKITWVCIAILFISCSIILSFKF